MNQKYKSCWPLANEYPLHNLKLKLTKFTDITKSSQLPNRDNIYYLEVLCYC